MNIVRMALADVNHPHPQNPRDMPAEDSEEIKKLDASLETDYFEAIIWNQRNGLLVSGHVRVPRMIHLGYTHADVQVVDYDEETHMARMIAANAHTGKTNEQKLGKLLTSIKKGSSEKLTLAMMRLKEQNKLIRRVADKTPVKIIKSEGEEEDDQDKEAPQQQAPPVIAAPARYIIGFPVTLAEKQKFDAVKQAVGIANDKDAFIEILNRFQL